MEDQEPQEVPMEQVLDEIRHMLMTDTRLTSERSLSQGLDTETETQSSVRTVQALSEGEKSEIREPVFDLPAYFLLTPEMRCDDPMASPTPNQTGVSGGAATPQTDVVYARTRQILNRLQTAGSDMPVSPELERWLQSNLPALVEKIIAEKMPK